jgi:hypothetical protein
MKSTKSTKSYDQPNEKFAPLLTLPTEKLQFINNLLFKEKKVVKVVSILQDDYGLYKDISSSTLRIYLQQYKKEYKDAWNTFHLDGTVHVEDKIPDELKKDIPTYLGDPKLSKWIPFGRLKVLLSEAVTKFDSMQEMERLATLQYDRVLKAVEYENSLPTETIDAKGKVIRHMGLDKGVRGEMETLHNMLKNIVTIQMDLGIRHRIEQQQKLSVALDPHHMKLMEEFNVMQQITEATSKALEVVTGFKDNSDTSITVDNESSS